MSLSRDLSRPWTWAGGEPVRAQVFNNGDGKFKLSLDTEITSAGVWLDEQGLETLMMLCVAGLTEYRMDRDGVDVSS